MARSRPRSSTANEPDKDRLVDVSLMDSMLNLMVFECQEAQFPSGRQRPVYAPMKTTDGHVIIAPISQKNFEQMADAMQRADLKTDPGSPQVRRA